MKAEVPDELTIEYADQGEFVGDNGTIFLRKEDVTTTIGKAMLAAFALGVGVGIVLTMMLVEGGVAL